VRAPNEGEKENEKSVRTSTREPAIRNWAEEQTPQRSETPPPIDTWDRHAVMRKVASLPKKLCLPTVWSV
jgi:hypothetical protein